MDLLVTLAPFLELNIPFAGVYGRNDGDREGLKVFRLARKQDNVFSHARMLEFRDFLAARQVPWPLVAAHVSVYAQFVCGILYLLGLFVRPAAVLMIVRPTVSATRTAWSPRKTAGTCGSWTATATTSARPGRNSSSIRTATPATAPPATAMP